MTASAWKTSAGAAARVPVARVPNLTRALETFQKAGFFVLGLDMEGDVELPGLALATEPVVVVVGSEGKGLSRLVRETCDQVVSIPMSSAVESLNAGVAAGVTLYEIARQRAADALTRIPNRHPSRPGPPDHSRPDRLPWAAWRRAREPTTSA